MIQLEIQKDAIKGGNVWVRFNGQTKRGQFEELFDVDESKLRLKDANVIINCPLFTSVFEVCQDNSLTSISATSKSIAIGTSTGGIGIIPRMLLQDSNITDSHIVSKSNEIDIENHETQRKLHGKAIYNPAAHIVSTNKVLFFPSNSVLLTLGLDTAICIWSVVDSPIENPARKFFGGHKSQVTDCVMIGRGRNIITGGLDGQIIIWEIGSAEKLWSGRRIKALDDSVNCLAISQMNSSTITDDQNGKYFDTQGKVIAVGHKSGVVSLWDCYLRLSLCEFDTKLEISSIASNGTTIITGHIDGSIRAWNFNLEDKKVNMEWEISIETVEDLEDDFTVKKIVYANSIYVLTPRKFVKLSKSGQLEEVIAGWDWLNDFTITDNAIYGAGKFGELFQWDL